MGYERVGVTRTVRYDSGLLLIRGLCWKPLERLYDYSWNNLDLTVTANWESFSLFYSYCKIPY